MRDIVERLREQIITNAFDMGQIGPSLLAERLIGERQDAADEIERLREGIKRIQIAAEFHAQDGVSDHVMRYAHESTKRLCDELLSQFGRA